MLSRVPHYVHDDGILEHVVDYVDVSRKEWVRLDVQRRVHPTYTAAYASQYPCQRIPERPQSLPGSIADRGILLVWHRGIRHVSHPFLEKRTQFLGLGRLRIEEVRALKGVQREVEEEVARPPIS